MKKYVPLLLATLMSLGLSTAYADESSDESVSASYEAEIAKLNQKLSELKKNTGDKWHVDSYIGSEQERDHDKDWHLAVGSIATSPYIGAFIYQDNSAWLYDLQFLKTYVDRNHAYNRTRFQFGVTRSFPFKLADKDAGFKLRLGYRNDNWHYGPKVSATALTRTAEERHEYWVKPSFSYKYSDNLSFLASFSFRFLDRRLDYAQQNKPNVSKSDWGHINEHFAGGTYRFNAKNALTLYYLNINEKFVNTLYNKEHFLWAMYNYKFDNGFRVIPYTRFSLKHAKQSFRNSDNIQTVFREKNRSRYGFQSIYPFTRQTSLFTDFYYRPEKMWEKGVRKRNQFIFMALELRHNF
ncbi:hypothetical protein RHO12_05390 [Orbus sturtevantii]|uniref:hypothetical protein n=1 Tax=Orbus sturtevantii TaxID=3074109 RepID=UPI00370D861B